MFVNHVRNQITRFLIIYTGRYCVKETCPILHKYKCLFHSIYFIYRGQLFGLQTKLALLELNNWISRKSLNRLEGRLFLAVTHIASYKSVDKQRQ